MRKETSPSGNQNYMRFIPEIAAITCIALFLGWSLKSTSDNTPQINNNPAILQIEGTDTLEINWDRTP